MGSSRVDSFMFWAVVLNVLIRWLVSRFPHSGAKSPPLYGDYEAQRHWMEITYALSPSEWYKNSTQNDLQYWGLDYPPLTAYHSWLNGWVASHFNQSWIALGKSRGIQTYHHRIFMRSTVLVTDLLVYFTAMISFFMKLDKNLSNRERAMSATIGLLYPALILIDHGHFQYNHMSLGLTLWAINMIFREKYAKAAIFFCLALNYKQISLYYSFPFAFYLLGICFKRGFRGVPTFISLAIVVLMTFVLCWLPFLENQETVLSVVKRLFPLSRGLYEDKVANVWCSLEIFIKFKKLFPVEKMAALASIIIFTLNIPSSLHLLFNPVPKKFVYALAYSSLVFFLFAFQVHEKSILFAGLPAILLINDSPLVTLWFYVISTFSLLPLMVKDHLMIPTCALTVLIIVIYFAFFYDMRLSNLSILFSGKPLIFSASIIGCIFLALVDKIIEPPSKYPHIFILLNSIYSCIHFIGFALYYHSRLFREASYHESLKNKSQ